MIRKLSILIYFSFFFMIGTGFAQVGESSRIQNIQNNLEVLSVENKGLSEKLNINIQNATLTNFLLAVSQVHKINISVSPGLEGITIVNNFSDVTVANLLVFLSRDYDLDIEFIGNILSVKKYVPPVVAPQERIIPISFDPAGNTITIDLKNDLLEKSFRKIMDASGKNLLWSSGMENIPLTIYLKEVPFDAAMEKVAFANNLTLSKSRDGFYVFEDNNPVANTGSPGQPNTNNNRSRPVRKRGSNFYFKVLDTVNKMVEVDFENTPVASIINDIGQDLNINVFTATPLTNAGNATYKAKRINFDELLIDLFESGSQPTPVQNNGNQQQGAPVISNGAFTFKKEGDIYYFGTQDQLSVRHIEVIPLRHRSIELLSDPSGGSGRSVGRTFQSPTNFQNYYGGQGLGFGNQSSFAGNQGFNNVQQQNRSTNRLSQSTNLGGSGTSSPSQGLEEIIPDDVKAGLDIRSDFELNSFIVSGPTQGINRLKAFLKSIDKPVPVILIEVMIIEVSRSATVETGVSWGIGEEEITTQGNIFPSADITLGAKTVNKVIGGFDGFGSFNLGQVVPEFFARIKAMESNGNIKIRSTPKMATLNGHRANFSSGTTSYYAITSRNIFGSDNPQTSEIKNYVPIDAELGLTIKPLVSADGQVTLDLFVIQSDFNGERIDEDAPPGINSREFSSIIRVKDQDMVVLGGLEERLKNDSGSGVPFLARIPVIKWLFSERRREDTRKKLTVLIKPTIIK